MPEEVSCSLADWAQVVVAFISVIVACLALYVSGRALKIANKTAQAELVTLFLNEYASTKMQDYLI